MAFDALFTGVSGLGAYQEQIDVISNNIANVGTTGYKGQAVSFEDSLYQTQAAASAPTATNGGVNAQQAGAGVRIAAIAGDFAQGGLQTTGINTNLAINGDGFFTLDGINGSGTPSYTRDGNFSLNDSGYLYDPSSGLAVLGYPIGAGGTVSQVAPPQPIQIPFGLKALAVGTGFGDKTGTANDKVFDVALGGNLNQTDYITAVSSGGASLISTTITTTVYDSLGGSHPVHVTYTPDTSATLPAMVANPGGTAVTAATEWQYTVTSGDGSLDGASTVLGTGYLFFDQNGQFINSSSDPLGTAPGSNHLAGQAPGATAGANVVTITQWSGTAGADNATLVGTGTPRPAVIGLDFSWMTSLATAATANTIAQNGSTAGILSNISIGTDGTITGAFTNGEHTTLGRVALASFQNEAGLTRLGANRFIASANSGIAEYGFAGQGRLGTIDAGALEQSNVSIASEFTKMILAQRSFEANAKTITTADENLRFVVELKR